MSSLADSPFAILSFLAAPAILTNASTVLALGTSNRLARAADRARLLSNQLLAAKPPTPTSPDAAATALQSKDFGHALARSRLLIRALRCFYLAAGSFAAGTCVSLIGATAGYFEISAMARVGQALTIFAAIVGVSSIAAGTAILVFETRLALRMLDDQQAAVDAWRHRAGS